jgi:hypothetical protein
VGWLVQSICRLGSLRVSEAAQPERERLRQQVAKFSA